MPDRMDKDFSGPPKSLEEVGLRIDYLRSQGRTMNGMHGPLTIGEMAERVGTTTDRVSDSKRFFQSDRDGRT